MIDDIRYGFRQLYKNPGFAAVAVITLALGIGAAAAMFGLIQGVLLSPPPYVAAGPARARHAGADSMASPYEAQPTNRAVDGVARVEPHVRAAGALPLDVQLPRPAGRKRIAWRDGGQPELLQAAWPQAHARRASSSTPSRRDRTRRRPRSSSATTCGSDGSTATRASSARPSGSAACRRRCRSSA